MASQESDKTINDEFTLPPIDSASHPTNNPASPQPHETATLTQPTLLSTLPHIQDDLSASSETTSLHNSPISVIAITSPILNPQRLPDGSYTAKSATGDLTFPSPNTGRDNTIRGFQKASEYFARILQSPLHWSSPMNSPNFPTKIHSTQIPRSLSIAGRRSKSISKARSSSDSAIMDSIQSKHGDVLDEVREHNKHLEEMSTMANLHTKLHEYRTRITELEEQCWRWKAKSEELNGKVDELTGQNSSLQDQVNSMTANQASMQQDVRDLTADKSKLQTQVRTLTTDNMDFKRLQDKLKSQHESNKSDVEQYKAELEDIRKELKKEQKSKKQLISQNDERDQLLTDLKDLHGQMEEMEDTKRKLDQDLKKTKRSLEHVEKVNAELAKEKQSVEDKFAQQRSHTVTASKALKEMRDKSQREQKNQQQTVNQLHKEIDRLKIRVENQKGTKVNEFKREYVQMMDEIDNMRQLNIMLQEQLFGLEHTMGVAAEKSKKQQNKLKDKIRELKNTSMTGSEEAQGADENKTGQQEASQALIADPLDSKPRSDEELDMTGARAVEVDSLATDQILEQQEDVSDEAFAEEQTSDQPNALLDDTEDADSLGSLFDDQDITEAQALLEKQLYETQAAATDNVDAELDVREAETPVVLQHSEAKGDAANDADVDDVLVSQLDERDTEKLEASIAMQGAEMYNTPFREAGEGNSSKLLFDQPNQTAQAIVRMPDFRTDDANIVDARENGDSSSTCSTAERSEDDRVPRQSRRSLGDEGIKSRRQSTATNFSVAHGETTAQSQRYTPLETVNPSDYIPDNEAAQNLLEQGAINDYDEDLTIRAPHLTEQVVEAAHDGATELAGKETEFDNHDGLKERGQILKEQQKKFAQDASGESAAQGLKEQDAGPDRFASARSTAQHVLTVFDPKEQNAKENEIERFLASLEKERQNVGEETSVKSETKNNSVPSKSRRLSPTGMSLDQQIFLEEDRKDVNSSEQDMQVRKDVAMETGLGALQERRTEVLRDRDATTKVVEGWETTTGAVDEVSSKSAEDLGDPKQPSYFGDKFKEPTSMIVEITKATYMGAIYRSNAIHTLIFFMVLCFAFFAWSFGAAAREERNIWLTANKAPIHRILLENAMADGTRLISSYLTHSRLTGMADTMNPGQTLVTGFSRMRKM